MLQMKGAESGAELNESKHSNEATRQRGGESPVQVGVCKLGSCQNRNGCLIRQADPIVQ